MYPLAERRSQPATLSLPICAIKGIIEGFKLFGHVLPCYAHSLVLIRGVKIAERRSGTCGVGFETADAVGSK